MSSKNSPKRTKFFDIKVEAKKYYPSKENDKPPRGKGVASYAFLKVHTASRKVPSSYRLSII